MGPFQMPSLHQHPQLALLTSLSLLLKDKIHVMWIAQDKKDQCSSVNKAQVIFTLTLMLSFRAWEG